MAGRDVRDATHGSCHPPGVLRPYSAHGPRLERRRDDPAGEPWGERDRGLPVLVPGLRHHLRGAVRHGIPVVLEAAARDRMPGGRGRGGLGAVPGHTAGRVRMIRASRSAAQTVLRLSDLPAILFPVPQVHLSKGPLIQNEGWYFQSTLLP